MGSELDLSAYEAAVVEHVVLGAARKRMFEAVVPPDQAWSVDLERGTITLGARTYRAQILGTLSKSDRTFLWAWANPSAAAWAASMAGVNGLRALGAMPGNAVFAERKIAEGWVDARELAMVCGELTGGHPAYFADAGAATAILLIGDTGVDATNVPLVYVPGVLLDAQSYTAVDYRPCVTRFLTRLRMSVSSSGNVTRATRDRDSVTVHWDAEQRVAKVDVAAT